MKNTHKAIEVLKEHLEIKIGRLAEPLLLQGINPKDDKECHKALVVLAHLHAIEDYLKTTSSQP